tara:strand:- start:1371 stop:1883 length:513 start_codon:yes stop_codon:yes gene_type:complete
MKKLILFFIIPLIFSCSSEPEIVTVEGLYQIELPGDMTPIASGVMNEDASLQYANLISEKYLMIIHEDKSEFINIFGEENYFDTYVDFLTNALETNYGEDGYTSNIYLNDYSRAAKLFEISGIVDGVDIIWNTIYFEGEDNLYQICYWTLTGRDYNMVELMNFAKTFREL